MFKDYLELFDKYIKPLLNINPDWQKYIPWLTQQISANQDLQIEKLLPYVVETQEDIKDGKPTLWALIRSKNVDVNKLKLPDLVKEISGWTKLTVSQGKIVYQFKSGWTLQKLVSKRQLEDEGKAIKLASDPDSDVRKYLARNPSIHRDVAIKLASDDNIYVPDYDVRLHLATNPSQAVQEILKEIKQRTASRYLPSLLEAVAKRIRR